MPREIEGGVFSTVVVIWGLCMLNSVLDDAFVFLRRRLAIFPLYK